MFYLVSREPYVKINRQRKALASGKKVYGITDLREHLDSELEAYNLLFA